MQIVCYSHFMNPTLRTFLELVEMNSVSQHEQQIGLFLETKLLSLNLYTELDEADNLYAYLPGEGATILLNAHMDTVPLAYEVKPIVENGMVHTGGKTALGADDKAAIAAILTVLEEIKVHELSHPNLVILFTTCEEMGLLGASHIDMNKLQGIDYGFTFDASGPVGTFITDAPGYDKLEATFWGKGTHAGFSPERGISAIQMGSDAVAAMKLLRIDHETTANVGSFLAPGSKNIVCDKAELVFEARSLDKDKLHSQVEHMKHCLHSAAEKHGGKVEINDVHMYDEYHHDSNDPPFVHLKKATSSLGLPFMLEPTLGGSDANILNAKGLTTVVCSTGYEAPHTTSETITQEQLEKLTSLVRALAIH